MKKRDKNLLYAAFVVLLIGCLTAIEKNKDIYSLTQVIVVLAIGILPIGLVIIIKILSKVRRNAIRADEFRMRAEIERQTDVMIDNLKYGLPVLKVPNFYMGDDVLHLYQPAVLAKTENKMVGMMNETTEMTNEAYGFYKTFINPDHEQFRTESVGTSQVIYEDVTNHIIGQLALTNKSIVFIHQQFGFDIKINELTFAQEINNGLSMQSADSVYTVLMDKPRYFLAVLNAVRNNP